MHFRIQGIHASTVVVTMLDTTVEVKFAMIVPVMRSHCSNASKFMRFSFAAVDPRQDSEE